MAFKTTDHRSHNPPDVGYQLNPTRWDYQHHQVDHHLGYSPPGDPDRQNSIGTHDLHGVPASSLDNTLPLNGVDYPAHATQEEYDPMEPHVAHHTIPVDRNILPQIETGDGLRAYKAHSSVEVDHTDGHSHSGSVLQLATVSSPEYMSGQLLISQGSNSTMRPQNIMDDVTSDFTRTFAGPTSGNQAAIGPSSTTRRLPTQDSSSHDLSYIYTPSFSDDKPVSTAYALLGPMFNTGPGGSGSWTTLWIHRSCDVVVTYVLELGDA
ncbi:hypothetical protein D9619_007936 [Psilocybe cf. subviscida]|uniref:Uncharacterized protein n=1 Tax=Psilocybe cf. subviscida TaxID=2480587 RepID=A0A8H5ESQ9_9AGAR|nr:hypothetical protein D9619_007936 [Psilocybe cf. subviscida]